MMPLSLRLQFGVCILCRFFLKKLGKLGIDGLDIKSGNRAAVLSQIREKNTSHSGINSILGLGVDVKPTAKLDVK